MAFERNLTNGLTMYFNGKPSVDRIQKWILLARLKEEDKEFSCPVCKDKLHSCACEKELANEILHDILKHEIKNVKIE